MAGLRVGLGDLVHPKQLCSSMTRNESLEVDTQGSHLSFCLSSSLCFSCHCPLHGLGDPDVFDLHTGHFDSPLLCGTVEGGLGDKQHARKSTVLAERKPRGVPCLDRRTGQTCTAGRGMLQGHQHPAWCVHHSPMKHLLVNTSVASLLPPKL